MSTSLPNSLIGAAYATPGARFGRETRDAISGERCMQWLLKKNCSTSPRQLGSAYAFLALLSMGIAAGFWAMGATLVFPFASAELLLVGLALVVYARHATDGEEIRLGSQGLTVLHTCGSRVRKVEFQPTWVRVEPEHGDRSLIEFSGQGRRIAVGRFVRPELRQQLADEFRWALRRWYPVQANVTT
jgi:uncharacterized membrane protein